MLRADFISGQSEYARRGSGMRFPLIMSIPLQDIQISRAVDTIETCTFSFVLTNYNFDKFPLEQDTRPIFIKVYYNDEIIFKGQLYSYDYDFITQTVNCSCNALTYFLNYVAAVPSAITNKKPILGSLQSLLDYWGEPNSGTIISTYVNFKIARFFHALNPTRVVSADLRQEEKLLSQFDKLAKYNRKLYYRVFDEVNFTISGGGTDRLFLLEIGEMSYDTNFTFDNTNISSFNIQKITEPPLKYIIPFGGTYKTGTPATTLNKLNLGQYDGSFGTLDGDFTIGTYTPVAEPAVTFVDNNNIQTNNFYNSNLFTTNDFEYNQFTTKYYEDINPSTQENPTNAEIVEAAYAMYLQSIGDLEQKENLREFNINATDFNFNTQPGNKVYLQYDVNNLTYDINTEQQKYVSISNLSFPKTPMFVKSMNINVNAIGEKTCDLVLVENNKFYTPNKQDDFLGSYQRHLRRDGEFSNVINPRYVSGYYTYTITGVAANSTFNGNPSYRTTVNKIGAANFGDSNVTPVNTDPIQWFTIDIADKELYYDTGLNESFYSNGIAPGFEGCGGILYAYNNVHRIGFDPINFPQVSVANFQFHVQKNDNWTVNDTITVKILIVFDP